MRSRGAACCCGAFFLALALDAARAFKVNSLGGNITVARYSARPAIRWALAPDFYELLLPRLYTENSFPLPIGNYFASPERVHEAIAQAFDVWQANSPSLRFVDVTERCTAERLWLPVEEQHCYSSPWCVNYEATGPLQNSWEDGQTDIDRTSKCSYATCLECERADVVVGGFFQHNRGFADHTLPQPSSLSRTPFPPHPTHSPPPTPRHPQVRRPRRGARNEARGVAVAAARHQRSARARRHTLRSAQRGRAGSVGLGRLPAGTELWAG